MSNDITSEQHDDLKLFQFLLNSLLEDEDKPFDRTMLILSNMAGAVISFHPDSDELVEQFTTDVRRRVQNYKKINDAEAEEAVQASMTPGES